MNQLFAFGFKNQIRYWRTKQKQEVYFVIVRRGKPPVAIEAKWKAGGTTDYKNLLHFARNHDDKVFSDVIRLELPGGELSEVTLDEFTVIRRS